MTGTITGFAPLLLCQALLLQPLALHSQSAQRAPGDLFDYSRTRVRVVSTEQVDIVDGVSQSLVLLRATPTDSIVARLFEPAPTNSGGKPVRLPAIIMGHGAPGSGANYGPRARYLARKGAIVLVVDAPFVRRDPQMPMTFTPRDSAEIVQQVVSYRRVFDYLQSRSDVNASRIGFVGSSHSAYVGALLAGTEPRLRAVVLAMGDVGYVQHFQEADGTWNQYFPSSLPAEQVDHWVRALRPLDAELWLSRSRVPYLLLQNGLNDEAVPRHASEKLHAAAPRKALHQWYDSGHRVPAEAFFAQLEFLSDALGVSSPVLSDEAGPYGKQGRSR